MIYLVAVALIVSVLGFYRRARQEGVWSVSVDTLAAAVVGWIAGWLIGLGARVGMWSIPFFNGTESRITLEGSLQVVLVFSLYGIGLGIVYELFFRTLLKRRGLVFGSLVTIVSSFPLGAAAAQQLSFSPKPLSLAIICLLLVSLMFIPFSIALEFFLVRWHELRRKATKPLTGLRSE